MGKYVLGIDASTQGTKAVLFDCAGKAAAQYSLRHRQYINEKGWVEHDLEEIYANVLKAAEEVIKEASVNPENISAVGLSNQRETAAAWDRKSKKPVCRAVVWQCARAEAVCKTIKAPEARMIKSRTGLPLSPYFTGAKLCWIMDNIAEAAQLKNEGRLCMGTIDSWLLFRLTEGKCFKTDFSNASRTQLFNIYSLEWDEDVCRIFKVDKRCLPEVCDSNSIFGSTDFGGFLKKKIPICAVMGDSQAALFGEGCHDEGMTKATCGTGASVMMNIGKKPPKDIENLSVSLAWGIDGRADYVLEGNVNYAGATLTWLREALEMIKDDKEIVHLIKKANSEDTTYLIPAFTGLGAPYWKAGARAEIVGMTGRTGKAEIVKAAVESIAYQIADIINEMKKEGFLIKEPLNCDGGPSKNIYLMQLISDISNISVHVQKQEILSCIGAAYMAGIKAGIYHMSIFLNREKKVYVPSIKAEASRKKYSGWRTAAERTGQYCAFTERMIQ